MDVNLAPVQALYQPVAAGQSPAPSELHTSQIDDGIGKIGALDERPEKNSATGDVQAGADEHSANTQEATRTALNDPNSAESRLLQELKKRDREVRTHELAHLSAAGQFARGGPNFQFERGPDGQRYAVGGHVSIDTSAVRGDPEATLRKAEVVRRAALAPANPSPQDRSVAAKASSMAAGARREIALVQLRETTHQPTRGQTQQHGLADAQQSVPPNQVQDKIRQSGAFDETLTTFSLVA